VPERVLVIGAGPAGLAAAWALDRAGLPTVLLERADAVCSSWRGHYVGLRLNSPRRMSSLPGLRMRRQLGRWVSRQDFVEYVEQYAGRLQPDIRFGVEAYRVDRVQEQWQVATAQGPLCARSVVVATGLNAHPHLPDWSGIDTYGGELLHAADYVEPGPLCGRDVLVVGLGASGTDIALELACAGARRVRVAVRSPPLIFPRDPTIAIMSQLVKHVSLPDRLVDRLSLLLHDLLWGDLTRYGLARPTQGLATSIATRGHGATIDRGLVGALKQGQIEVVPSVRRLHPDSVELVDGSHIAPETVVAATGQRPGLETLVGHLGVLRKPCGLPTLHGAQTSSAAPDLYFLGYRLPAGQLPDLGVDARAIARRIARSRERRSRAGAR
jgi:putative flavoprotein involved in K+ transport